MEKNNLELNYESYLKGLQNTQIGDYVVIKKIGEGAYGTIYQAVNRSTKKIVAMKVIDLKEIDKDPNKKVKEIRKRLSETQSQLMNLCKSQNILKLEEVFENDTLKIMVIEYCNGKTLEDEIKAQRRIEQTKAILILKQIVNGLLEMHRHNIVHRDLKAENILIHNGVYKIADFGFSKTIMSEVDTKHTTLGTIITMAPEIMAREPYGVKVDIWSTGVIFYQMLSGALPFTPMSTAQMHDQIRNTKIIDEKNCLLTRGKVKCSPQVIDFIKKALEINPEKRIGFSELLKHPMFDRKDKLQPGQFAININIKNIQVKDMKNLKKNLDDEVQQFIAKVNKQPDVPATNRRQPVIKKVDVKQVQEVLKKVDKKDDQMYMWAKETYLSCQKTETILDEIIQPIQNSKIFSYNRFEIEFMYLLISRCLFNMSPINQKIEKAEKEKNQEKKAEKEKNQENQKKTEKIQIAENLKENVDDLYDRVAKKFENYSKKLTTEETRFMSIISDKWSNFVKKSEIKEKDRFLGGIEEAIDVQTSKIMAQELKDFTRQQQIDYTSNKYIPEIIKNLLQKSNNNEKIAKVVKLLLCYKQINMVTLNELGKTAFQSYVKSLMK